MGEEVWLLRPDGAVLRVRPRERGSGSDFILGGFGGDQILAGTGADLVFGGADDDFLGVAEAMVDAEAILFATPVYWYSMSGRLKRFFDRLTDRQMAAMKRWIRAQPDLPIEPPNQYELL